jgi:hypothetical protein
MHERVVEILLALAVIAAVALVLAAQIASVPGWPRARWQDGSRHEP